MHFSVDNFLKVLVLVTQCLTFWSSESSMSPNSRGAVFHKIFLPKFGHFKFFDVFCLNSVTFYEKKYQYVITAVLGPEEYFKYM